LWVILHFKKEKETYSSFWSFAFSIFLLPFFWRRKKFKIDGWLCFLEEDDDDESFSVESRVEDADVIGEWLSLWPWSMLFAPVDSNDELKDVGSGVGETGLWCWAWFDVSGVFLGRSAVKEDATAATGNGDGDLTKATLWDRSPIGSFIAAERLPRELDKADALAVGSGKGDWLSRKQERDDNDVE